MKKFNYFLIIILLLGGFLRLYGLNWDQGNHLHPDERAIMMFSLPLNFPSSFLELFFPSSPLNTHFFAYGTLPQYLLKIVGSIMGNFYPPFASYEQINLVGRFMSGLFDIGTIFLIYALGKKLFLQKVGLIGAFFYSISVFPIQTAHFFAVDTMLTFFIFSTIYSIILFYEKPTIKKALLVGLLFGASLATKTSALLIIVSVEVALVSDFLLIFFKNPHKPKFWFLHTPKFAKSLFIDGAIIVLVTIASFIAFEPYAILDFQNFYRQTLEQSRMTHDAFTFPYTLQYVGKIPYFYELRNIFLWGQGPILATLSFLGFVHTMYIILKKNKEKKWAQEFILIVFFLSYFIVVGKFAVGWMRYMLPLYPLLSLFAALFALKFYKRLLPYFNYQFQILNFKFQIGLLVILVFICSILVWPLSFIQIYTQPNTRNLASQWIYKNIPQGAKIAREHWDDGLPIGGNVNYDITELPIYDFGNPDIKTKIYNTIDQSNYIIIASNRLHSPLQRIAKNCKNWKISLERCPNNANIYYQRLFNGSLGYKKVAEFENPPKIPFLNIPINDQSADESFTVYDHPKVMIFKNEKIH